MRILPALALFGLALLLVTPVAAATFSSTTPVVGRSLSVTCDQAPDKTLDSGQPVVVYVELLQAGSTVWKDSVQTQVGAPWTLTHDLPASGAFELAHWYRRFGGAEAICRLVQSLVIIECPPAAVSPLDVDQ
jgi:hypothetical protein